MQNMNVTVKGTKLIIEVDLAQEVGVVEKSGNMMVGKTSGFEPIPSIAGHSINVNVLRKKGAEPYKAARKSGQKDEAAEQLSI